MKRSRDKIIKSASWEIRYNTSLLFFDRGGSVMQRLLESEGTEALPRWAYGTNGMELGNPETFTRFILDAKRAAAVNENLRPVEDYNGSNHRALRFLRDAVGLLDISTVVRVGHRLIYLVPTDATFEQFAQSLTRQLTLLDDFGSIEACQAEDVSAVWVSKHNGYSFRWAVGPLALREFRGRFMAHERPANATKDQRVFYPQVSLLVDVDAFRDGEAADSSALDTFFAAAYAYMDEQATKLAHAIREE